MTTGILSVYTFDRPDLAGDFSYKNIAGFFEFVPAVAVNVLDFSVLQQIRPAIEFRIDLYNAFNTSKFYALIDTTPQVDGQSLGNNPDALIYRIARAMNHYGYRTSDVRAGWIEWRDVPYRGQDPGLHHDGELLNQVGFNFHIHRGLGTVDNDGWITFYYRFALDSDGRLTAKVDGWAYQFGGGDGLSDGGHDLGQILRTELPAFLPALQQFLDDFCLDAGFFTNGIRSAEGRPLFDAFYLLPGDGNWSFGAVDVRGYPAPGVGNGARPTDTEVTLALIPKMPPIQPGPQSIPRSYTRDFARALPENAETLQQTQHASGCAPVDARATDGRCERDLSRSRS